ncbi:MAG: hypothetical protein K9H49_13895 [Bacteroidales bacterium]|nr:hypothetical protein [Bacteroidales bacterium]MCF8390263.1 hypothetical protein [Bacteroidales bacterium]
MKPINSIKRHIHNFVGKKLDKKYIVFESDDWGSERIPFKKSLKYLALSGVDADNSPFNNLDSLETGNDLSALFETLRNFKDQQERHPVITANSVTANPDFEKIKASHFKDYHYENTLLTYSNKKGCENSYELIKEGMAAGIYHPQFHGREHLNVNQWLKALQSGNKILLAAFKSRVYSVDHNIMKSKRKNFMAAFDGISSKDTEHHRIILKDGLSMFEEMFGYSSKSFIAPTYVWSPSLEILLKENGIEYIQGLPVQNAPVLQDKYRKIYHYQGQRNKLNQIYFVRNCFFEPSLNPGFNWIEDCLNRLRIIFFWGKPAIIGTHRINFIGSLNEDNRTKNLKLFSELLKMILKTWPDVEFTTTDKLGEIYSS